MLMLGQVESYSESSMSIPYYYQWEYPVLLNCTQKCDSDYNHRVLWAYTRADYSHNPIATNTSHCKSVAVVAYKYMLYKLTHLAYVKEERSAPRTLRCSKQSHVQQTANCMRSQYWLMVSGFSSMTTTCPNIHDYCKLWFLSVPHY